MQLFSLAAPAIAPLLAQIVPAPRTLEEILEQLRQRVAGHPGRTGLWLLAGVFVKLVSCWLASMIVASERGRFVNVLKVMGLYLVVAIGGAVIFGIASATHQAFASLPVVIGASLLSLIVLFAIPMKVYEIGFLPALGFLVVSLIFNVIGQFALTFAPGSPSSDLKWAIEQYVALKPEERQKLAGTLRKHLPALSEAPAVNAESAEALAADQSKSFPERQKALETIYEDLQRRRAALKPADVTAIAAYKKDEARYKALLDQLKADVAARSSPADAPP